MQHSSVLVCQQITTYHIYMSCLLHAMEPTKCSTSILGHSLPSKRSICDSLEKVCYEYWCLKPLLPRFCHIHYDMYHSCLKSTLSFRAVIIYRMYQFIAKFSYKRYTGNSAIFIKMALLKYNLFCFLQQHN